MSVSQPSREQNFVMVAPDPATESVERLRRQALRLLTESRADEAPEAPQSEDQDSARRDGEVPASSTPSMIVGVLAMPAVFLAIVFVALAVFGKPGPDAVPPAAAPAALAQPQSVRAISPTPVAAMTESPGVITLPDDARIQSIALDGDRVALHVEGPAGREIVVYDFREGRRIAVAAIESFSIEAADTLGMLTGPPPPAAAPRTEATAAPEAPPSPAFKVEPRLKPRSTP